MAIGARFYQKTHNEIVSMEVENEEINLMLVQFYSLSDFEVKKNLPHPMQTQNPLLYISSRI